LSSHQNRLGHLTLTLFGEFNYQISNGAYQSLKSRKSEAVLLALALSEPGGMSRGALVNQLWPDLTNDRARAGLRQALSRIRALSPEAIVVPRAGWVSLSRENVTCDLWDLQAATQKGVSTEILPLPANRPYLF